MFPYFLVFVIALLFMLSSGKNQKPTFLLFFYFFYLALFVGLGDMIGGYDRYIYGDAFDTIADEVRKGSSLENVKYLVKGSEFGYFYWQVLIGHITRNRYIYFLITTILIYTLYFIAFKDNIEDYPMGCIVFLALLYYFTMTYLRQMIAVGFCFVSVRFIVKRKLIPFLILLFLAKSFHSSALIFLPMYFISMKKYSSKSIYVLLVICFIIGLSPLPMAVLQSFSPDERVGTDEQGFRIEYVLEVAAFLWLFATNMRQIDNSKKTCLFLNMSYVFCGVLLLFMRYGQGGRFGWYFMPGIIYILSLISTRKNALPWAKPIVVTLCLLLFLRLTFGWKPLIAPYKTFLTPGEPAGDGGTYKYYEYDQRYTVNKFYR